MKTQLIREALDKAEKKFMNSATGVIPEDAFWLLMEAVRLLTIECEKEAAENARTAHIASCLANGIQPD